MKKLTISILSLLILITLGGCQSKFESQTALQESRTTLNEFINLYDDKERITKEYNEETINNFFKENQRNYFTENFNENILPDKLEELTYDHQKDFLKIGQQFLFLAVTEDEDGVFWNTVEIKNDEIDPEKETVTFYVSSKSPSRPSRSVEMIKVDEKWKINNILES